MWQQFQRLQLNENMQTLFLNKRLLLRKVFPVLFIALLLAFIWIVHHSNLFLDESTPHTNSRLPVFSSKDSERLQRIEIDTDTDQSEVNNNGNDILFQQQSSNNEDLVESDKNGAGNTQQGGGHINPKDTSRDGDEQTAENIGNANK